MTPDELIEHVEKIRDERRKKPRKNVGFCDMCGLSDSHLNDGLCACCIEKYKVKT